MLGSQRCMETELLNCAITWVTSLLRYSPSQPPGRHSEAWGGLSIPTPTPVFHCCCSATQSCLTVCDPWTAGCQASLSFTISWSLLKLMSIELVMPSNHLILCQPLLVWPSIFPSIRVFSRELVLRITWPKYWSFSFSISPSNEYSGLIPFRID